MSDNSKARQQLESIYGKGCMFKKARIEDQIEALKTIKTYKITKIVSCRKKSYLSFTFFPLI